MTNVSWTPRFVRNVALLSVVQARAHFFRSVSDLRAAFVPLAQSAFVYADALAFYWRALLEEAEYERAEKETSE